MLESLKTNVGKHLWEHQDKAIDFAITCLNSGDSPCLIRMPTGTGKTGVIACLTMLSNSQSSIVLTPWANLRDQMVDHLRKDFWGDIGMLPPGRAVTHLLPSKACKTFKPGIPTVYVATFATLNELRREYPTDYQTLSNIISLVIVDEGHYEPAVEWKKSVTGLKASTLLMTATPYRNDLKLFRITNPQKSVYHLTHKAAVDEGIIRTLKFADLPGPTDMPSLARNFAKEWTNAKNTGQLPHKTPRAIICCSGCAEIESVVGELRRNKIDAIGIHERFSSSSDPSLLENVPQKKDLTKAEVWVHQNKLTEGLDDTRFCYLALFTQIQNDRKLIQQIGRILRHKKGQPKKPAFVLSPPAFCTKNQWDAYLSFEQNIKLLEPQHFKKVVDALLDSQPDVEYLDGSFRRRFEPLNLAKDSQVIIPPSVLVRKKLPNFTLSGYIQDCTDTLNVEDAVILGPDMNAPCQQSQEYALWVYASIGNSRALERTSFYEIQLETHCVVVTGEFVFFADSRGNYPVDYIEESTILVEAGKLYAYLDDTFKPTEISLNSTIPYNTAVRGARIHGHNLLGVPASLTDRIQICCGVRGRSEKAGRRYLGVVKGRLRQEIIESTRKQHGLTTFIEWVKETSKMLMSNVKQNAVFGRYMPICPPPTHPVPRTICLDFQLENCTLMTTDGTPCELKVPALNVQEELVNNKLHYRVSLTFDDGRGRTIQSKLQIDYQDTKKRFWFSHVEGASIRACGDGETESKQKYLAEFLNHRQETVLIGLDGGEIVYQARSFYKIDYKHAEQNLLGLIEHLQTVSPCYSEKGTKEQIDKLKSSVSTKFLPDTLFRAIADDKIPLPFDSELIICVDLGTECADFIIANFTERKLALIHAKAGKGRKIPAADWHEVVAQAMKNLAYLTPNAETPDRATSWRAVAKWNKTNILILQKKPATCPEGVPLWKMIRKEIIENANAELYVALVTTGIVSINALTDAVNNPKKRTPETAQLFHLLDGLNGHTRQLGVRLKIYDIPYKK